MGCSSAEKSKTMRALLNQLLHHDESLSEKDEDSLVEKIEAISPDPAILNYIFGKEYEHLTIDEIVEKAFSYQPIILGDHSQKSADD